MFYTDKKYLSILYSVSLHHMINMATIRSFSCPERSQNNTSFIPFHGTGYLLNGNEVTSQEPSQTSELLQIQERQETKLEKVPQHEYSGYIIFEFFIL